MSTDHSDHATDIHRGDSWVTRYLKPEHGKAIRRRIEQRFDAILHEITRSDARNVRQMSYARWLLDNSHLVRLALQQIETDLPSAYRRQLAKIEVASNTGIPRVFALVDDAVAHSGLPIEPASIEAFFTDCPSFTTSSKRLTLGELWAVPIALRITLLLRLCDAAELTQKMTNEGTEPTDDGVGVTVIAGCITSLRTVATFAWSDFVERCSEVESTMRRDPAGFYARMDFATRDRYRAVVEQVAERAAVEQWQVARATVKLAQLAKDNSDDLHLQHIGYYLIDTGRQQLEHRVNYRPSPAQKVKRSLQRHKVGLYLSAIVALATIGSVALMLGLLTNNAAPIAAITAALIALIPLLSVSSGVVNFFLTLFVPPRQLPKLDFSEGIPRDQQSIVVVPMLLSSSEDIVENLATLERNYLGNADPRLRFALLSDFADATEAETPEDQLLLNQVLSGIDALNNTYAVKGASPFQLFHRRRLWNENSQRWMGWERKRGKLEEFNEMLRGATDTSYIVEHGGRAADLQHTKYVITLDADSYVPTGNAVQLIGTMAHPLNRPRVDPDSNRVVGGYTVIQPRLEANPVTSTDTLFARIFAGDVMLDLYSNAVSDVYQDVFGDAVFAGKGIYDLDAFRDSVANQLPINAVLSHDLLEGLLGRAGLASDIVVLENYPSNYQIYLKRLHRWVRGDWQLLPWLSGAKISGARPFKPGVIGRWKLFDNLRRSLVTPAILVLLILGWTWLPGNPVMWTLVFALLPGLPILLHITLAFRTSLWRWGTIESSLRNLTGHAGADIARWLLALTFLPAEAYVVTGAVLRTLYRVAVSRRRMLEWSTAAQASRDFGNGNATLNSWRTLWFGPATAIATALVILLTNPHALIASAVLLVLWLCSPLIALRLGRRIEKRTPVPLTEPDVLLIRGIARDTWRFFERFVGPDTCWLPPDNVQEYPQRTIAERTSPTNIGMLLLSALTAYDFGYLGPRQLIARLSDTLQSVQRLHKHRGHLFNWYATRDGKPLDPLYVSTVDSGNFVAALIVVRQALDELPHTAQALERTILGLGDELAALRRQLFADETLEEDVATNALLSSLDQAHTVLSSTEQPLAVIHLFEHQYCGKIEQAFLEALEQQPNRWSAEEIANFRENSQVFRQRIRIILDDIEMYAPWLERLWSPPSRLTGSEYQSQLKSLTDLLGTLLSTGGLEQRLEHAGLVVSDLLTKLALVQGDDAVDDARAWLEALRPEIASALEAMHTLDQSRQALIDCVTTLIENTDFGFLYDANRNLFRVGYNASTGEADSSYYDLLASEARIASFVAIAKGDIPAKHWMHLGRPLTRIRGLRILLSWSATAFEYLMPRLVMRGPLTGLLNQSCEGAVQEQIRFGREHDIPWGVSESGYAQFDAQNHYQYFAFGIPKLGLKWDQGERLVISSYSSALALEYAPAETVRNIRRLISSKASGHYGLYEALDFGSAHEPRPDRPRVVQSYMAHHQGMILVAIGNALHHDLTVHRFHRDPRIASVEHLLYERLPQRLQTRPLERLPAPLKEMDTVTAAVSQWPVARDVPELAVLSNGRLSSRLADQGGGALYWRGKAVTRWDPLATGAVGGSCVYFQDLDKHRIRCLGGEPLPDGAESLFAPHTVEFRAHEKEMLLRMTVAVAPADDVEIRRITITNDGASTRHIVVAFYSEPVLGLDEADRRHPAFSKLFVESQVLQEQRTVLFRRRPRDTGQPPMYLAQTALAPPSGEIDCRIEVDRGAFFGRGRDPTKPAGLLDPSYQFTETARANLDPCAAIVLTLDIPARSTVQCAFLSSVADSRAAAVTALQPFQSLQRIDWAIEAARLHSERELTAIGADSDTVRASYKLLARILWPRTLPHIANDAFNTVHRVQDSLWRRGISGDRPIITLRIDGEEDLKPAEILLKSVAYLSRKNVALDIVFLDDSKGGYTYPTNDRLRKLVDTHLASGRERDGASVFIVPMGNIAADEKSDLIVAARLFIDTKQHTFDAGFGSPIRPPEPMPAFIPQPSSPLSGEPVAPISQREALLLTNSLGGLLPESDGYSLLISNDSQTPSPWCNVLANAQFGTLVSESGSMCTWWGNSSEYRLTPWSNDPVIDRTGEAIYVRDEETGDSWSLTPQPKPDDSPYRVTHGIGESVFEHNSHGLEQRLQVFVDAVEPIKYLRVRLTNTWPRERRLTVTFAAEWLLGNGFTADRHLLFPEQDSDTDALLVRSGFSRERSVQVAFVASGLPAHGVSFDGDEFFGRRRSWSTPAALAAVGLSGRIEPSAQPCAVYQVHVEIPTGGTRDFHFVLGAAKDRQAATDLISRARDVTWVETRYQAMQENWNRLLNTWQVRTPDIAADAMINRWLLYQVIASRLWARIGFYQASGGFGYRDQLQDVLALLDTKPEAAREQIGVAASRQFEEGDVLHWWHDAPLRGVRTRCSDDLLWLAYAVAEYIEVTDDASILKDTAAFLQGEPLAEHELERYAEYQTGNQTASIYEHCYRAIDARIAFGAHGMPFIGTGDWNDGLNRVGEKGQGESVWMAWFLIIVCRRFAPLCREMNDHGRADHYETIAADLLKHAQDSAWAGDWYLRGYFDDGTPLGAPGDKESEIDLNAQTWAVLADPQSAKAHRAMQAVEEKLVDADHRLIKLLAPPFEKTAHDPGYIRSYPPGVRENGGQYTHAAVWALWAAVEMGDTERAMRWFEWLNPLKRTSTDEEIQRYRLEPYVTAGDIYGVGAFAGRGGWSWYTGSAAWLYRLAIRQLLGLQRRGDRLFVRPCVPDSWPVFEATLNHRDAEYRLRIHEPANVRNDELYIVNNGAVIDAQSITLEEHGQFDLDVFPSDAARRYWQSQHEPTSIEA